MKLPERLFGTTERAEMSRWSRRRFNSSKRSMQHSILPCPSCLRRNAPHGLLRSSKQGVSKWADQQKEYRTEGKGSFSESGHANVTKTFPTRQLRIVPLSLQPCGAACSIALLRHAALGTVAQLEERWLKEVSGWRSCQMCGFDSRQFPCAFAESVSSRAQSGAWFSPICCVSRSSVADYAILRIPILDATIDASPAWLNS